MKPKPKKKIKATVYKYVKIYKNLLKGHKRNKITKT